MALNDKQLRAARKKIGMIFQHFNLMNSRTVYGNVLYPLRDAKLSKAEKEQKIEQLLSLVGLLINVMSIPLNSLAGRSNELPLPER